MTANDYDGTHCRAVVQCRYVRLRVCTLEPKDVVLTRLLDSDLELRVVRLKTGVARFGPKYFWNDALLNY